MLHPKQQLTMAIQTRRFIEKQFKVSISFKGPECFISIVIIWIEYFTIIIYKLWKVYICLTGRLVQLSCSCQPHLPLLREHWGRDYNRRITCYSETVILHRGSGNPITGNLPAARSSDNSFPLESPRSEGRKTTPWGPREEPGDRMPFIIRGRPLRGKYRDPDQTLSGLCQTDIMRRAVYHVQKSSWRGKVEETCRYLHFIPIWIVSPARMRQELHRTTEKRRSGRFRVCCWPTCGHMLCLAVALVL